jgi:hypothetical protein
MNKIAKLIITVYLIALHAMVLSQTYPDASEHSRFVYVHHGKLYTPNGKELALWGVNLQPCLSWEYNRLKNVGVSLTAKDLRRVTDASLDELELMNVTMIRCHLTPADFTDAEGYLVPTIYLDMLDYMIAEASKRGIWLTFAFINQMGSAAVSTSIYAKADRSAWIYDPNVVAASRNYISQLLNRVNPYTGKTYKDTPDIAAWEIINEPSVYSYQAIKSTPYYADYLAWIGNEKMADRQESYHHYRETLVRNYINGMHRLIRDQGDRRPIVWSVNWHRYRRGHEDVFRAVASSNAEVVSFCNYPGQDLVGERYWDNPKDLGNEDFSGWFKTYLKDESGYGWTLTEAFRAKAKVVYEFETFFNQRHYLYPIQALYFRALGVQYAGMWTYSMSDYAPYSSGSHVLSLTATPGKSASFMVAGAIFKDTQIYTKFDTISTNEQVGEHFAISKSRNLSMFYSGDTLYHTGSIIDWHPIELNVDRIKNIAGCGSSQAVSYTGNGMYFINETGNELHIDVMPDAIHVRELWRSGNGNQLVTELHRDVEHTMRIHFGRWKMKGNYTLYGIKDGKRKKIANLNGLSDIRIKPGKYIVRSEIY